MATIDDLRQALDNGNGKTTQQVIKKDDYEVQKASTFQRYMGKKLLCTTWLLKKDNEGNVIGKKFVSKKIKKIGDDMFKIGEARYFIDYDYVFEGERFFEYECDALNSIGALSCFDNAEPVDTVDGRINPQKADAYYTSLQGELFLHNNGIPRMWLLLAMIAAVIGVGAAAVIGIQYMSVSGKYTNEHATLLQYQTVYPPPPIQDKPVVQK